MQNYMPAPRDPERDPEEERADLLATLAAARELGPEMDRALADSYMQRRQDGQQAKAAVARDAGQRGGSSLMPGEHAGGRPWPMMMPALGVVAFIAILVLSGGHLFWLFWLPMALGGWWWNFGRPDERAAYRSQRRRMRDEYHMARREARYRARYGAPPEPPYEAEARNQEGWR